jgi:hypothetical protein
MARKTTVPKPAITDEVCLDADGPGEKMGNEHPGERWLMSVLRESRILIVNW